LNARVLDKLARTTGAVNVQVEVLEIAAVLTFSIGRALYSALETDDQGSMASVKAERGTSQPRA
jgi:hypothetical protein